MSLVTKRRFLQKKKPTLCKTNNHFMYLRIKAPRVYVDFDINKFKPGRYRSNIQESFHLPQN
ncbi:hypothetical protein HanXRQr2_Chr01g0044761 [Helianthus annuus]|uniref:Uncharacterized protein n=1 Tax=Helianthus annuus TaxID=4232 RepID=A0A9K3JYH6_HELAN|nr:hypothetical protein HanXRQr2_Chr01g0044761 [Helianthus annuus]